MQCAVETPKAWVSLHLPWSHSPVDTSQCLQHHSAEGCCHPQEGRTLWKEGRSGNTPCFLRSHGTQGTSRCSSSLEAPHWLGWNQLGFEAGVPTWSGDGGLLQGPWARQVHGAMGLSDWQILSSSLGPRPARPARVMDSPPSPRGVRGVLWAFSFHVHSGGVSR